VKDAYDNPIAGVTVTFSVASGGGGVTNATPSTNETGAAAVGSWKVGTAVGENTLTATIGGLPPVTFTASAKAGPPASLTKHAGDGQSATANEAVAVDPSVVVKDAYGNPVAGVSVTFAIASGGGALTDAGPVTNDDGVATVGAWKLGTVAGANTVSATVGDLRVYFTASARPGPVASVTVTPSNASFEVGESKQFAAVAHDVYGNDISDVAIDWSTSSGVATVDGSGNVTGQSVGLGAVIATVGTTSNSAQLHVLAPVASITMTPEQVTTVLTISKELRAIARDAAGNWLSDRTVTWSSSDPAMVAASTLRADGFQSYSGKVTGVGNGTATVTATVGRKSATAVVRSIAVRFSTVDPGSSYSCGIATDGEAFCWGSGGLLGDTTSRHDHPLPVLTDVRFDTLAAARSSASSFGHTCALTAAGSAYCWGFNGEGQLGNSSFEPFSATPVAVAGGLSFASITVGGSQTCALTTDGAAYCWGLSSSGTRNRIPVTFAPVMRFRSLSAGAAHACGVTTDNVAYCWGTNTYGQLGDSSITDRVDPTPVAGGLQFKSISAGAYHTCGVATGGASYCWGSGGFGQLGTGFSTNQNWPAPVAGNHTFDYIVVGFERSCGRTSVGNVYCWGGSSAFPVLEPRLASTVKFASVSVGRSHQCGVAIGGVAYCWGDNDDAQLGGGPGVGSGGFVRVVGQP
jgi:alpha-tubulin suppressor-like RCC1 family protein